MAKPYFGGVDLIRFLAAAMVAIGHLGVRAQLHPDSYPAVMVGWQGAPLAPSFWWGWVGVQIFFVVSGMLIANSAAKSNPVDFVKGRAKRLYPVVWLSVPIIAAAVLAYDFVPLGPTVIDIVGSMTLIPGAPIIEPVMWTLGVEVVFYGLVFFSLLSGRRGFLPIIAWGLTLISGLYLVVLSAGLIDLPPKLERLTLLRHGVFFGFGIFCWMASQKMLRCRDAIVMALAACFCMLEVYTKAAESSEFQGLSTALWEPVLVWALAAALLFGNSIKNVSTPNYFRLLGLATYPYYLLHQTVGGLTMRPLIAAGINPHIALMVALVAVFVVSILIVLVFEKPLAGTLGGVLNDFEQRYIRPKPAFRRLYSRGVQAT